MKDQNQRNLQSGEKEKRGLGSPEAPLDLLLEAGREALHLVIDLKDAVGRDLLEPLLGNLLLAKEYTLGRTKDESKERSVRHIEGGSSAIGARGGNAPKNSQTCCGCKGCS